MSLLYFFESIRNPVLDFIFSIITVLGEETVFMVVGMIVFWCISKHDGYFLLCTGFIGTLINQFMKMLFRVPRPWIKDPSFTIVESAREGASGYSFPSGHTQTSVGLYGGIAKRSRDMTVRITMIALCFLIPLSRMYLGVHTPLDVGVSVAIALILIFVLHPIFKKAENSPKIMYIIIGAMTLLTIAYLLFVCFYSFTKSVYSSESIHNLTSARENGFTLLGCMLGLIAVYTLDLKYTHFKTDAVWWAQGLKILGGLLLVVAAKELLRAPLDFIFGGHLISRSIRYFIMVLIGGGLWPMTFKYFSKLGRK